MCSFLAVEEGGGTACHKEKGHNQKFANAMHSMFPAQGVVKNRWLGGWRKAPLWDRESPFMEFGICSLGGCDP